MDRAPRRGDHRRRTQSEILGQPCCCEKMAGLVARRVDGEHLYGKASPIAELPCPSGLLPVQRAHDTLLGSSHDVAAVCSAEERPQSCLTEPAADGWLVKRSRSSNSPPRST